MAGAGSGPPEPAGYEKHFDTEHLKGDLRRRTVRGGAITLTSQGLKFALGVIRLIVLAWLLTPRDYGLFAMVSALTLVVNLFTDGGLFMATVTRERIGHREVSTLFWINVALSLILAGITAASAPLLAWFYGEPEVMWIAFALAPVPVLSGLTVQHEALLRRQMRFLAAGSIHTVAHAIGIGGAIAVAWAGGSYWALVTVTLVTPVCALVGVWIACDWRPGLPSRDIEIRDMIQFGANVTGSKVVGQIAGSLDATLLGWRWGSEAVGLYTKSFSVMMRPLTEANSPIAAVAMPSLSSLINEPERYRQAYMRVLEKLAMVTMPAAVFLIAMADPFIPFVLGEQWSEAVPIFRALGFLGWVLPVVASTQWLFLTQARTGPELRWSLLHLALKASAVAIGLPWGAVGIAIAASLLTWVEIPLLFAYVGRNGPVRARDIYRPLLPPTLSAGVALAVVWNLHDRLMELPPAAALALAGIATGALFLAALALVPQGRHAIADAWSAIGTLLPRRRS